VRSVNRELEKYPRLAGLSFMMTDNREVVYTNIADREGNPLHDALMSLTEEEQNDAAVKKIGGRRYSVQAFSLPVIYGKIVTAVPIRNLMKELDTLKQTSYALLAATLLLVFLSYTTL